MKISEEGRNLFKMAKRNLEVHKKFGEAAYLNFGPFFICFFSNPDICKQLIMNQENSVYNLHKPSTLFMRFQKRLITKSLIITEDDEWKFFF